MHSVYDWDLRILHMTAKNDISYHLYIRKDIVIVSGMSGSGKSLLCSLIKDAQMDKNPITQNDVPNIIILNSDNLPLLSSYEKNLSL